MSCSFSGLWLNVMGPLRYARAMCHSSACLPRAPGGRLAVRCCTAACVTAYTKVIKKVRVVLQRVPNARHISRWKTTETYLLIRFEAVYAQLRRILSALSWADIYLLTSHALRPRARTKVHPPRIRDQGSRSGSWTRQPLRRHYIELYVYLSGV
jgi:hypothetical protein